MFQKIKQKKLDELSTAVKKYLQANFKAPAAPATNSSSHKGPQERTNIGTDNKKSVYINEPLTIQFQTWDNYDSDIIQVAMRDLSSNNSPLRTLETLEKNTDMSFVEKMRDHISKRHLQDSEVYKAAQVDRRLFSKIVSDRTYKPAKDTCIALCLAMKLTLSETNDLLSRAGYTFSHSSKRDVILEYFFREHIYSLNDVNEILNRLEQKILGRV